MAREAGSQCEIGLIGNTKRPQIRPQVPDFR